MNKKTSGGALFVGLGIFLSRIAGLVRERVFAHYFGNSDFGDAFKAALKIPNFLQNLFGEGVLSASFIPSYASLIGRGKEDEAAELASTIATLLVLSTSILVALGIWSTPFLIDLIAPGFVGEKRNLTIEIVQILFPGTGLLVISAWCLGILNSHKNFFLPYVTPVLMNVVMIAALWIYGQSSSQRDLAITISYAFILGSAAQFLIQLPKTLRLVKKLQPRCSLNSDSKIVLKSFVPVVVSRGVVQISAYIDNILASLLPTGAVSTIAYAQTIYLLPISLFGMSVSVAELPTLSQAQGSEEEIKAFLHQRLRQALRNLSFFVIPSAVAFIFIGKFIVGLLFQTGAFNEETTQTVWMVLAGYSLGLLASTQGRLLSSTFYSFKDTKTPLRFASLRVLVASSLGYLFAFPLPKFLGLSESWGTVGITVAAGLAGWIEFFLLKQSLEKKIGSLGSFWKFQAPLWLSALLGACLAWAGAFALANTHFFIRSLISISIFGVSYLIATHLFGVAESRSFSDKILKKMKLK